MTVDVLVVGAGRLDALRRVLTALRIPAWEI